MHKITPWLWFDTEAEEAAQYYLSVFKDSRITDVTHYAEGSPRAGTVMTVSFEVAGQPFVGLNGGPEFSFSEAVSFMVRCEDQAEVDEYWDRLIGDGGTESQCGWLKDKYGLSWQIVPAELSSLLADPDPGRAHRALQAMLAMQKLDINAMKRAADDDTH